MRKNSPSQCYWLWRCVDQIETRIRKVKLVQKRYSWDVWVYASWHSLSMFHANGIADLIRRYYVQSAEYHKLSLVPASQRDFQQHSLIQAYCTVNTTDQLKNDFHAQTGHLSQNSCWHSNISIIRWRRNRCWPQWYHLCGNVWDVDEMRHNICSP